MDKQEISRYGDISMEIDDSAEKRGQFGNRHVFELFLSGFTLQGSNIRAIYVKCTFGIVGCYWEILNMIGLK